jgi:hypothetical protein
VNEESGGKPARELTTTEGVFTFHVYPETFWEPLEVATNSSLLVEESTSIAITQYDLRVAVRDRFYETLFRPKFFKIFFIFK